MGLRGWGYLRGIRAGFEDVVLMWRRIWTGVQKNELFCGELDWFYGV